MGLRVSAIVKKSEASIALDFGHLLRGVDPVSEGPTKLGMTLLSLRNSGKSLKTLIGELGFELFEYLVLIIPCESWPILSDKL